MSAHPHEDATGTIAVEERGPILIGRITGSPHGELVSGVVTDLAALVEGAEASTDVRAVVLTGTYPGRFIAHASLEWLQQGAAHLPDIGLRAAKAASRAAEVGRRTVPGLVDRTPLRDVAMLELFHDTMLAMNASGVTYVAALNGSALGGGFELAQACDLRMAADGPYVFGQCESIMGIMPGGGR